MSRLTANMDINISELLAQIEVDDREEDIIREAQTILRLSKTKCANLGPKEESLRSYAVTDLALGKLGKPFSREKLIKAAPANEKVYNAACQKLRNLLGALVAPKGGTIEQLAVKFSGGSAERSRVLLNAFEEACRSELPADKRGRLEYNTPLYHAAAFCVASVEAKAKLNRKAVASEVQVQIQELDWICVNMVEACGLSSIEHVSKAFRMNPPGAGGRGTNEAKRRKGAGASPGSIARGERAHESDTSPCATTRLDVSGSNFSSGEGVDSGVLPASCLIAERHQHPAGAAAQTTERSTDPAVCLRQFVRRLRTLESPLYTMYRKETLREAHT